MCSCYQIRYVSDSTQMTFLRLLSDRAKQTITYHCKNSVAWYNEESQDYEHSIKLMGDNGIELHASSSNKFKPRIVRDDCRVCSVLLIYSFSFLIRTFNISVRIPTFLFYVPCFFSLLNRKLRNKRDWSDHSHFYFKFSLCGVNISDSAPRRLLLIARNSK